MQKHYRNPSHSSLAVRGLSPRRLRGIAGLAAVAIVAAPSALAGSATYDFGTDPNSIPGISLVTNHDQPWQASGGNPGGFLALTYPQDSQSTKVLFPDIDNGQLVKAFTFEADIRVGNSDGDRGADGFSVSFARGSDPVLADLTLPDAAFAGGVPEGGTTTGIAVSFDTWAGNTLPDTADIEGILVRVDNVTILRQALATRHGACEDATSLQTGPRDPAFWANFGDPRSPESWQTLCWQPFSIELDDTGKLTVTWKGNVLLDAEQTTYFPSVGRLVLAGRTGGENEHTHFDNIRITTTLADGPIVGLPTGDACGVSIPIADAGTIIPVQNTITLTVDGQSVTPAISKSGDTTTLAFDNPTGTFWASGSTHDLVISFTDSNSQQSSQTRSFTVPVFSTIPASAATTQFTSSSSGFMVRTHQQSFGRGPGDANNIANAEQQLGGGFINSEGEPAVNQAIPSGTPNGMWERATVNWEQNFGAAGNFSLNSTPAIADEDVPGIPGSEGSTDNFAVEILTFLELSQGCHVFGVNSDDGFAARLGHSPFGPLLGSFATGRGAADTLFSVYVEQAGVYPIRLSYWEAGGGASVEFFSVDEDGVRHLVNDRTDPEAIRAYSTGRTGAYLASFNPYTGFTGAERRPAISATFRDDLTTVDRSTIRLIVDGQEITNPQTSTSGNTYTVTHTPTADYAFNSAHTARVIYTIGGTTQTNDINFTVRNFSLRDMEGGFSIEAENFDFDGGQTAASVSTMPYTGGEYTGLGAVLNVDYWQTDTGPFNADTGAPDGYIYRTGIPAEQAGPSRFVPMSAYQDAGTLDMVRPGFEVLENYAIGWSGGGDWYNYTRTVPAGNYKIVGAQSHGDAAGTADRLVASYGAVIAGEGTANQTVVPFGSYSTPATGAYGENALSVAQLNGRDAVVRFPGGEVTIRATIQSGDFDWFSLVPTTEPAAAPSATVNPANGINSALPLNITISDAFRSGTVAPGSVQLMVNGTDVTASANVTDTPAGITARFTPQGGQVNYTLTFSDSTGTSYTNSGSFFSIYNANNFVIEAEDFNYGGGQTQPNASTMPLQAGLYNGLSAVHDTDYHDDTDTPDSNLYRLGESPNAPMDSPGGGLDRGTFVLSQNYKLGWIGNNEWYNYTRTFPNQTYNVYAALSHGDANGQTTGALQIVGANNSTTNELGIFNQPGGTGGWGANRLVPLTDANGNLAAVPLNGATTVRYDAGVGDFDYLIFTPGSAVQVAQDITSPNDLIEGFGGTWPAGENPTNVFNNNSTKYLNFGAEPTSAPFQGPVGVTVTPAAGATTVTGIRFYTANDAPERDPADYVLEGSNDGTTFTQIASGSLNLPTTRTPAGQNMLNGPRQEVTFANDTAYTTYRLTFNNVRNNATANSMQIGEIELLGATGGNPGGPVISVTRSGANITLTWQGGGSLEASPVVGPGAVWTVVDSDGSYTTTASEGQRFFRVRQ